MEHSLWIAKLVYVDSLSAERKFDAGCCVRSVCDGDHHRRRGHWRFLLLPALRGFEPILAEQVITVEDQAGQGRLGALFPI